MLETKEPHLDDFTLLRYVAFDLDEIERRKVSGHVETCQICQATLGEIEELNRELAAVAKDPTARIEWELDDLPEGDPFRRRSLSDARPRRHSADSADFAARAVAASEAGSELSILILEAAKTSAQALEAELGVLILTDPAHRFALLYALQKAGPSIAECPARFLAFAEQAIAHLRSGAEEIVMEASLVPDLALFGQAHQLAGQACLWTGDFERAGACFSLAYRFFGQLDDELAVSRVEQLESQRRFFTGNGEEALVLARRATSTAELFDVEDDVARGHVAIGMALQRLDRHQEAVEAFRSGLSIFEGLALWSNYVGAVNAMATSLVALGRLGEARRQFATALRRLSRDQHRSWLPFIRKGLAEVLFSAGRYRDAAVSAAQATRLYLENGMRSRSLLSSLFEVESWARAGDLTRARHRLDLFRTEIANEGLKDPTLSRLINEIFSGSQPDFQMIAELRRSAAQALGERLGEMRA